MSRLGLALQPFPRAQAIRKEGASPCRLVGMQNSYSACGGKEALISLLKTWGLSLLVSVYISEQLC